MITVLDNDHILHVFQSLCTNAFIGCFFLANVFLEGMPNSTRYQLFAMIHILRSQETFCHGNHFIFHNNINQTLGKAEKKHIIGIIQ